MPPRPESIHIGQSGRVAEAGCLVKYVHGVRSWRFMPSRLPLIELNGGMFFFIFDVSFLCKRSGCEPRRRRAEHALCALSAELSCDCVAVAAQ